MTKKKTRRDGVLEVRIQQLQEQLEQFAFVPGEHKGFEHIHYCRFCHYSREYINKHGHGEGCLLNPELPK